MTNRISCLLGALLLTFGALFAQQSSDLDFCATQERTEWMKKYQAGQITPVTTKSLNTQYIPLHLVIVGRDDGTGYINPVDMLGAIQLLNTSFAQYDIQFFIDGDVDFVNSSAYYDHSFSVGRQMMSENNIRDKMNVYFVDNAAGACGYYSPGPDAIAMSNGCTSANNTDFVHEVGHFFSLDHTFYGWESVGEISEINLEDRAPATVFYRGEDVAVEKVDGSNCDDAADGFCDTTPDYLMERWTCNGAGEYRDSLTDPDSLKFAVPGANFMSYSLGDCKGEFSPEQVTAMRTNLASRLRLDENGPSNPVSANGADVNLLLPVNNATVEFSDFVELVWNTTPNADYYLVQINSSTNFTGTVLDSYITSDTSIIVTENLVARRRYYWRVRPVNRYSVDSDYSEVYRFRNGEFTVSTMDETLNAALTVSPNPVRGGQELRIAGRDLGTGGSLSYQLLDPAGRVLQSREGLTVPATGFTDYISTNDMPAGIYFLRLQLDDRQVTRRVVVW
ncbi:zinc-dependent metalloprotease [Lewinella sp. W8]|uniref:zinc-dependent metalloprotease n=1 Tax=Lewinella sp. W8 TaxID=2528208 RepID=UPI001C129C18|nr:zinc-dependent metalloprotease [Lewinella sp. W8]